MEAPLASLITKVDAVAIPSQDAERSRRFYVDTLGLRPDERSRSEFWIGDTCVEIVEPEKMGMTFRPIRNGLALLRVEDVAAARAQLEAARLTRFGRVAACVALRGVPTPGARS